MTAQKIDGNAIARSIREKLHEQIDEQQKSNSRFKPSLKIIQGEFTLQHNAWYCD
jgi:methylenetetrahydrofolate dehydrogenase (NADP+)/methenyltetrahydrofolate cyclohydrolase/formyltetrahydrofolate synthetase